MGAGEAFGGLIASMPHDAYGNEYELGGYVLSKRFGIARVIVVALGEDGEACVVGSCAGTADLNPRRRSKWATWLFRARSCVAVSVDGLPEPED